MRLSSINKSILVLLGGTAISQMIAVLISPILTRFYSPAEFGSFGNFVGLISILALISNGRYDLAIVSPDDESDAVSIFLVSITISLIFSSILLVIADLFPNSLNLIGINSIEVSLVSLAVFTAALYQSLYYMSNRFENYKAISISRLGQISTISGLQLIAYKFGETGLILGQIIGQIISSLLLIYFNRGLLKYSSSAISSMRKLSRMYSNFPKFFLPAHTINRISAQVPIFLLTVLFSASYAGLFFLLSRIFSAPINLIGSSVGDVFRREASNQYKSTGECHMLFKSMRNRLFLASLLIGIGSIFLSVFFKNIFGKEWSNAGEILLLLTPFYMLKVVTTPLSYMFIITESYKFDIFWQIMVIIFSLISIYVGFLFKNIYIAIALYSTLLSLLQIYNYIASSRLARGKELKYGLI